MAEPQGLSVCVVYSPQARTVHQYPLTLPEGATVLHALQASGLDEMVAGRNSQLGVWGRTATADQALRAGDRIEVYRPLRVDPKVARRERFRKQGARSAGLFATRRSNAKSGY